jgi:hypothetical protein
MSPHAVSGRSPLVASSDIRLNGGMCRNIRPLNNFDPPVTEDELRSAALQYVRKIAGSTKPSKANEAAYDKAIELITEASRELIDSLVTSAPPKNREEEAAKARARSAARFQAAS